MDHRIAVKGMTDRQLVDALYTEMAEFSFLTKYIFGTGIEEIDVNAWNDVEVQYSNGNTMKLDEHFNSPEHAVNVIRRMLHVSGMVLDNASPAIQAPMSWITSAELVAAVSNAGGMGTLGPNAGQTIGTKDVVETGERLRREIHKTRQLTDKPFGVNYIIPFDESTDNLFGQQILKVLNEKKVKIVVAIGAANIKEIKKLKQLGFTVVFRELSPTVAGAKAAEEAGLI